MSELRGRAAQGEERRQAILDAAIEVFSRGGSRGGALVEIASKAGVTPANVLYHFGSKENLLLRVIVERDRRAGTMSSDLDADGGLTAIVAGFRRFVEVIEGERGLAALHVVLQTENLEPGAPAHQYFVNRSAFVRTWVNAALLADQRRGIVRSDLDCEVKAREVVAFLEGATMTWLLDPATALRALYDSYLEAFLRDVSVLLAT